MRSRTRRRPGRGNRGNRTSSLALDGGRLIHRPWARGRLCSTTHQPMRCTSLSAIMCRRPNITCSRSFRNSSTSSSPNTPICFSCSLPFSSRSPTCLQPIVIPPLHRCALCCWYLRSRNVWRITNGERRTSLSIILKRRSSRDQPFTRRHGWMCQLVTLFVSSPNSHSQLTW